MQRRNGIRIELDTIGHTNVTLLIVRAAARVEVEQLARDAGAADAAGVLVFEFQLATLRASVTQRFPFVARQFRQRLRAPELGAAHASNPILSMAGGICR